MVMLRAGHTLQLTVVALLGLGTIAVHSAGMTIGPTNSDGIIGLPIVWSRHSIYALLAIAAMILTSRINIRHILQMRGLYNPVLWFMLVSLVLVALTLVPGVGKTVNGACRWLYLGPRQYGLTFQPSELVKWMMVLAIACWCTRRGSAMALFGFGLAPALGFVALACGMIMIEDLGTGALIGLVSACLLVAGGARLWHLALMLPFGIAALVGEILVSPYRMTRLTTFLDPWADPLGKGYHAIQSILAIAQGGLVGRGLGNGIQKFGYLPEDTTDFIFAIICEEMGLAGAALVVGLYLLLLWSGMAIVRDCKDTFGRLIGLGVLLTVGLQALINMAVVTVVVPTKGIALPLLSAGGTGWVLTASALGLLAALDTANQIESSQEPASEHEAAISQARMAFE